MNSSTLLATIDSIRLVFYGECHRYDDQFRSMNESTTSGIVNYCRGYYRYVKDYKLSSASGFALIFAPKIFLL